MPEALIKSETLAWAFARSGTDTESVAERMSVTEDKIISWLEGSKKPTFKQAQKLAKLLSIPFGFLFLSTPPADEIPLPEFRTIGSTRARIDNNIRDLLQDIQFKRTWFADYVGAAEVDRLAFIGKFNLDSPPTAIAADMRAALSDVDDKLFSRTQRSDKFLTQLMAAAESVGVWVMRSGIVGNNTHRPINVDKLRGFAISDPFLPIVFLNGKDAAAAQIFTLAHELAHLWIGSNDINSIDLADPQLATDQRTETKCNQVAAEFLVPANEFGIFWRSEVNFLDQVDDLSQRFSVSRIVIAKRALDFGHLNQKEYAEFFAHERARWQNNTKGSGGNFFATIPVRNGKKFTEAVLSEALSGRMLLREASGLLGVKPSKLKNVRASA